MNDQATGEGPADPQDKVSLLRRIDESRAQFDAALAGVGDLDAPLRDGGWSARDIVAHVAVWERRLARDIAATLRGETPERPAPGFTWEQMDALNDRDVATSRALPLASIMEERHAAFVETRALVDSLREDQLFVAGPFPWTETDPLALWVRYDMWEHYDEHLVDIQARDQKQ